MGHHNSTPPDNSELENNWIRNSIENRIILPQSQPLLGSWPYVVAPNNNMIGSANTTGHPSDGEEVREGQVSRAAPLTSSLPFA